MTWTGRQGPWWRVSEKTVADSMRRQGLVARRIKRRNGLTKQDKTAPKFPDLLWRTRSWPTSPPAASTTAAPKPSTASTRRPAASPTGSATSRTTGYGSCSPPTERAPTEDGLPTLDSEGPSYRPAPRRRALAYWVFMGSRTAVSRSSVTPPRQPVGRRVEPLTPLFGQSRTTRVSEHVHRGCIRTSGSPPTRRPASSTTRTTGAGRSAIRATSSTCSPLS